MTPPSWLLWSTAGADAAAGLRRRAVSAQRGFGFGPPDRDKRPLVGQFDADGTGDSMARGARRSAHMACDTTAARSGLRTTVASVRLQNLLAASEGSLRLRLRRVDAAAVGSRWRRPAPVCPPADVHLRAGAALRLGDGCARSSSSSERPTGRAELATFYNTDVDVPATVTVDGTRYRDVGVHFRGISSFFLVPAG